MYAWRGHLATIVDGICFAKIFVHMAHKNIGMFEAERHVQKWFAVVICVAHEV